VAPHPLWHHPYNLRLSNLNLYGSSFYQADFVTDRAFLGEFEHLVLAAALRLKDGYGAELIRELEERTGRRVPGGALYITLDRLERKGYLRSRMGDPDPKRGGRPKRFVGVTPAGVRALAEHREALLRIWEGLELQLEDA
jgi:PadR family transcriptional regulator, regulatory protein PadR